MNYKMIQGVVLTRVCGQNILVATRAAWGKCPYTLTLSALRGAFWQGLMLGMTEDEIINELLKKTRIRDTALRKQYNAFIDDMLQKGYMVAVEEDQ